MQRYGDLPKILSSFCFAALLSACGEADPRVNPQPVDPITPETTARFEAGICPKPIPSGLVEGQNVRCGNLIVPEDRSIAESKTISLSVMIVSGAKDPAPDPIVHLIGGPGGSYMGYQTVLGGDFGLGMSQKTGRDLILFDQRGTGNSKPFLSCKSIETLSVCASRLAADGIDLASYNTEENAADVDDLRRALGYEKINVYGQSYGTILAQTMMRLSPKGIRSVLLESTSAVPFDVFLTNSPKSLELALGRVISECSNDPACAAAFPDPAGDLQQILSIFAMNNTDPSSFLQAVNTLVQLAQGTSYVPLLLHAVVTNDQATTLAISKIVDEYSAFQFQAITGFSEIMYTTMDCYDYGPLLDSGKNQEVNGSAPPEFQSVFGIDAAQKAAMCAELPQSRVSKAQQEPVDSAIPTVLFSGTHDSNTPLEISIAVEKTLSLQHRFEFAGWGHVLLAFGNTCAMDVYAEFLAEPTKKPSNPCAGTTKTVFPTMVP